MKNSMKIMGALLLSALAVGCNDAEYDTLGAHAYINQSKEASSEKVVVDPTAGGDVVINVSLSEAATKESKFRLVVDESVLEQYNKTEGSSFLTVPEGIFEVAQEITIPAGKKISEPVSIHFNPFTKEMAGESYALPLRLESVDGVVPTTTTTSRYIVTTESIVMSSLPQFNGGAGLAADGFPMSLPQYTVECRFQVSNTSNRNRAVFTNGGSILLRFEDPNSWDPNFPLHSLVQFQGEGWYLNPTINFTPNVWQHLALTYDGNAVTLYVNGQFAGSKEGYCDPNFKAACWFGGDAGGGHGTGDSWWYGCKILCAELRIWKTCRTAAQIVNNITSTSARSQDLVAYWRMNEGSGNVFEDCTGNGHTLRTSKNPTWVDGILSTDTATPWK